jgi:D-alanyl-D-alanine carboxypeptidase/D-alanyl-D-alanine-endopeptidase (penicillin-binding protein 4)
MRLALILVALTIAWSCSPISKGKLTRSLRTTEQRFKDNTGFVVFDVEKNKTVFDFNGSTYFTPASNTKIFTFYSALKILGDSIPGIEYIQRGDSLIFWGTGDPSFLYRKVYFDSTIYAFLKSAAGHLYFSESNFYSPRFGPGWAWDDYTYDYSTERSPFPVYGNRVSTITDQNLIAVAPRYFSKTFRAGEARDRMEIIRELDENIFTAHPAKNISPVKELDVPIRLDSATFLGLMADTLKRPVSPVTKPLPPYANTLFSVHIDSLLRVMMQDSDNFIAEQLLLMCANVLSDSLKTEIAIDYMLKNYLKDLPDQPIWVDGSGLSRYNLFTPRCIVKLWTKILETVPKERLFALLASGGSKGTIQKWYQSDKPYIFGKTGTLSNHHCLSGFLVTRKGKILIFSFMNGSYTATTNAIRRNMESILSNIYEHY